MINIKIYKDQRGQEPFKKWTQRFKNKKIKARIYNRLTRVRLGNFGDYKNIGQGLFELRLHFGPGYRIYYGKIDKEIILLLAGGIKAKQNKDIKKAKQYWQEFKNHEKN